MANVLDLRRRIRSVKNTRQITKAMKMVSAAKLRRAQERALAARPYARMIASVLESLRRRVDLYDEKTGNLCHPLFLTRPEKRVLLIVVSGDKGFAGAFNANILKVAYQFITATPTRKSTSRPWAARDATSCAAAILPLSTPSRPTKMADASGAQPAPGPGRSSPATTPACW